MKISTIIGAVVLLLAGLVTVWWLKNFDHVPEHVYKGLKGDAREDPYLAMKRFLARMDVKLEERKPSATSNAKFNNWAPGGTVMLGDRRHVVMTPERVKQILAWVDAGGYLILEAEFPGRPDPLLAALDIERRRQNRPVRLLKKDATVAERNANWAENNLTDVSIPGNPRVLKVQFTAYQGLADPKHHALWTVENAQGMRMLQLKRGTGRITVVSNFDWLTYNGTYGLKQERAQPTNIGKYDHAEVLMTLLHQNPNFAKASLRLIWGEDDVSLLSLLFDEAWMALLALAALIVLWIWRVTPRFGPLQPEPPPAEQRLTAHLEASGRFFWRYLSPHMVYGKMRAAFERRLMERRPGLAHMRPAERYKELARLIDARSEAVARAFESPVMGAAEFVRNVRLLQRLQEKL